MAELLDILGQAHPTGGATVDVYTVPAGKQAVVKIIASNINIVDGKAIRVYIRKNGEALSNKQLLAYDSYVPKGSYTEVASGVCLGPGDVISARTADTDVTYTVLGSVVDRPTNGETFDVLGQVSATGAGLYSNVYTVPAGKQVFGSLVVCNISAITGALAGFFVYLRKNGAATANLNALIRNESLTPGANLSIHEITLGPGDILTVLNANANSNACTFTGSVMDR